MAIRHETKPAPDLVARTFQPRRRWLRRAHAHVESLRDLPPIACSAVTVARITGESSRRRQEHHPAADAAANGGKSRISTKCALGVAACPMGEGNNLICLGFSPFLYCGCQRPVRARIYLCQEGNRKIWNAHLLSSERVGKVAVACRLSTDLSMNETTTDSGFKEKVKSQEL